MVSNYVITYYHAVITTKYFLPAFKDEKCDHWEPAQHSLISLRSDWTRPDWVGGETSLSHSLSLSLSLSLSHIVLFIIGLL